MIGEACRLVGAVRSRLVRPASDVGGMMGPTWATTFLVFSASVAAVLHCQMPGRIRYPSTARLTTTEVTRPGHRGGEGLSRSTLVALLLIGFPTVSLGWWPGRRATARSRSRCKTP